LGRKIVQEQYYATTVNESLIILLYIPRLFENPNRLLANQFRRDCSHCMIGGGFLEPEAHSGLIELTRDGSVAHRLARRANALLLLDEGMSCEAITQVLYLDDDTIRTWHRLCKQMRDRP
jgi:hypothetical protein